MSDANQIGRRAGSMQCRHVIAFIPVIHRGAQLAQLSEHGQHQLLARAGDLIVRDQPRGQKPVAHPHRFISVFNQSFQLLAQITHFPRLASKLIAWIEVSIRTVRGETLKNISVQGAA